MRTARLPDAQAGIKIARRNINTSDIQITPAFWQKMKIMATIPIISLQIDGETMETLTDSIFLGSKITADGDCSH